MMELYRGSCLCRSVKFEIDEFLPQAVHCHCSMCRKFHGAAYATYAGVIRSKFRWVEGEEALKEFTAENGTTRTFCSHCGSSLVFSSPKASDNVVVIALGTVDGNVPVTPNAHIFVASSANWTVLCDELPRYEKGRDSSKLNE